MFFLKQQNFVKKIKGATIYVVALFFIVFALADLSVLQAYHGNENVGIPAEHHTYQDDDCSQEKPLDSTQSEQPSISSHDEHHNQDDDCSDKGECLAGCSHIIVSYFVFNANVFSEVRQTQESLFYENTTPKSEPTSIFRPPRTT